MPAIELWLFTVTDPLTGKRRRTTYRLTVEEARERYIDPEPIPGWLERREVNEPAGTDRRSAADRPGQPMCPLSGEDQRGNGSV